MMEDVWKPLLLAVVGALTPFAVWLAAEAAGAVKTWRLGKRHENALVRLDHAVTTAVRSVQQSRAGRAPRRADGSLPPEIAVELKAEAVAEARLNLGAHGLADLAEAFGLVAPRELDARIGRRVEAGVWELKTAAPPPAVSQPALPVMPSIPPGVQ